MKGFRSYILILFITIIIFFADKVSADWHVGNSRSNAYGAKANIWVPSSPIYLEESGESNWVSLLKPYWIQTGWRYYIIPYYPFPSSYIEHCSPPCTSEDDYFVDDIDYLSWGDISEYKIEHISGSTWCSYINGVLKNCAFVRSAPAPVYANSEVHVSSNNELNTQFSAVYYKTSDDLWFIFDQSNWVEDCPYLIEKDHPYFFHNYRGACMYLPMVLNH